MLFPLMITVDLQVDQKKPRMHIPAPRMKLPGHAESYNPPPEYLPSEEEVNWHPVSYIMVVMTCLSR